LMSKIITINHIYLVMYYKLPVFILYIQLLKSWLYKYFIIWNSYTMLILAYLLL